MEQPRGGSHRARAPRQSSNRGSAVVVAAARWVCAPAPRQFSSRGPVGVVLCEHTPATKPGLLPLPCERGPVVEQPRGGSHRARAPRQSSNRGSAVVVVAAGDCVSHDRRTHDDVGGARSNQQLARGASLARHRQCRLCARRRRCRLCQSRAGDAASPDAQTSLDARRRTRHGALVRRVRPAHARQGRRRSVDSTTRSRLGARSALPVSALRSALPERRTGVVTRVTFGDVSGSPAAPPDRALSVAASCSLRELPRLRSRASRIADPLARARSAVLSPLSWPRDGTAPRLKGGALPAGLQRGFGFGGWREAPSLPGRL